RPTENVTLIAERMVDGTVRIVATASYSTVSPGIAEAAFAVADRFQGKGLGTVLLERLAVIALQAGIQRFQAPTLAENPQMLEVFRDSGFEIRSKLAGGIVEVQLSLASTPASIAAEDRRRQLATRTSLRPLLEPGAVAVVGASQDQSSVGRRIL